MTETNRESSAFTWRALSAAATVAALTAASVCCSNSCLPKAVTTRMDFQILLHDGHDIALLPAHLVG